MRRISSFVGLPSKRSIGRRSIAPFVPWMRSQRLAQAAWREVRTVTVAFGHSSTLTQFVPEPSGSPGAARRTTCAFFGRPGIIGRMKSMWWQPRLYMMPPLKEAMYLL